MAVIDEFLRQYQSEHDYYFAVARLTARRCETALTDAGVRHLVTYRVKRADRLRGKLLKRNETHPYSNIESIREDIVDLAGVRIALFFPGDQENAEAWVASNFDVDPGGRKTFPGEPDTSDEGSSSSYEARFPGYCATHFRVRNRVEDLPDADRRYADARVEIQIASVLMLAWQEVHHDLAYKPFSGVLSEDEAAILDEVNGLVISGEIAFQRLQRAVERRLSEHDAVLLVISILLLTSTKERVRKLQNRRQIHDGSGGHPHAFPTVVQDGPTEGSRPVHPKLGHIA